MPNNTVKAAIAGQLSHKVWAGLGDAAEDPLDTILDTWLARGLQAPDKQTHQTHASH